MKEVLTGVRVIPVLLAYYITQSFFQSTGFYFALFKIGTFQR